MCIDELKKIIKSAGIVGAGGAGFPTHIKIDPRAKMILLNCAECEPLLKVHQQMLARFSHEILSALNTLSEILNADVIIAIKKTFKTTIASVYDAKADKYPRIRIELLEATYPSGDEILMIHETLGIVIPPGSLPIESGCIVLNVETVYNIYHALTGGKAVSHKWLSIAGEVANPMTAQIPVGMTIIEAVEKAGNVTIENPAFLVGGPMMGSLAAGSDKIEKTTNAIIVLPADHTLVMNAKSARRVQLNRVASACCHCRACTDMCPRYLLGYPIEASEIMRAMSARDTNASVFHGAMYCSLCGVCEMIACPQSLAPRALIKTVREAFAANKIRPEKCDAADISPMLPYRQVDVNRLKIRLGLAKYDFDTPMVDTSAESTASTH